MTHLIPLTLGQTAATPWTFGPLWFVLLALGAPAIAWLGLAWRRALDEDPHRLRRAGLRELRALLVRVRRSQSGPQPSHLHGWCQAAARTWGIRVCAPTGEQLSQSLRSQAGGGVSERAWRELWSMTERGLYAPDGAPASDWVERAAAVAAKVEIPGRERWLPNRLSHWLPSRTTAVILCLGLCSATCLISGRARADQATPPTVSLEDQKAAVAALRAHWNDWAAHYNIAAEQIQEQNWNYAVAHATVAFLLHPSSADNRDNLRSALQQAGSMDPTLRRLLYGAWFQRLPALLSPAGWQHLALGASLIVAASLSVLVLALYFPGRVRALQTGTRGVLATSALLYLCAVSAFNAYGPLAQPTAGMLLESVNLSPSPTELVPEQDTSPASAGAVVLPALHPFLGWEQVNLGTHLSGWVRKKAVMSLYGPPRQ